MEKLQKQALRVVYSEYNSTYTELRERADLPLLCTSRVRNQMIDVFKVFIQGNGPRYLRTFFKECERGYNHDNTRSTWSLDLPKYSTVKYGRNNFRCHGAKLWNSLDTSIKCGID